MTWHCMVVSSVGGCLFTLPFLLDFQNLGWDTIAQALILALFFGGGTALLPRLLASILIGFMMAMVTGKFPGPMAHPWAYKFTMGLTSVIVVHLFTPIGLVRFYLSELVDGGYDWRLEMAAAIAVYSGAIYLSQIIAQKYLQDIAT